MVAQPARTRERVMLNVFCHFAGNIIGGSFGLRRAPERRAENMPHIPRRPLQELLPSPARCLVKHGLRVPAPAFPAPRFHAQKRKKSTV
jgi:hypothetical protein